MLRNLKIYKCTNRFIKIEILCKEIIISILQPQKNGRNSSFYQLSNLRRLQK
jgi:hypothetical protein